MGGRRLEWAASEIIGRPTNQSINQSINQLTNKSINENVYSASSRSLFRGTPDPGPAEKNSLEKVVELRTGTV